MARQAAVKKASDLRHTAEERRTEVLQAAVAEFALHGLHGTSTEMIARRIGISQPYIFRLFPSKKALFLAAIGLYAVMSYSVAQGTRELGLRMALGAGVKDLLRLVMSRGLRLTIAGIIIGAGAAMMVTRSIGNLLYKVSPRDPIAFGAAFVILFAIAFIACLLPALRVKRMDPVRALRV